MSAKNLNNKNKLTEMTEQMAGALDFSHAKMSGSSGSYEYSTAFLAPKAKQIIGVWKVVEHTVDGLPYAEGYCRAALKDLPYDNAQYDAVYEFNHASSSLKCE